MNRERNPSRPIDSCTTAGPIHTRRRRARFRGNLIVLGIACSTLTWISGCSRSNAPSNEELHRAVRAGDATQLMAWLDDDPKLIESAMDTGTTLLHAAAQTGQMNCLALLMARGADFEAIDRRGRTPLYYAAAWGHTDAAAYLLDRGAKLDHRDYDGHQVLHIAVQNGNDELVSFLIVRGANVNAPLKGGTTPLHSAITLEFVEVAKVLVEAGADPHAKKDDGITPLRIARAKANKRILALLQSHNTE